MSKPIYDSEEENNILEEDNEEKTKPELLKYNIEIKKLYKLLVK